MRLRERRKKRNVKFEICPYFFEYCTRPLLHTFSLTFTIEGKEGRKKKKKKFFFLGVGVYVIQFASLLLILLLSTTSHTKTSSSSSFQPTQPSSNIIFIRSPRLHIFYFYYFYCFYCFCLSQ